MQEIEVGEYIRTKKGYIRKVIKRDIDKHILLDIGFDGANYLTKIEEKEDVIKHSKNIIKLLESEDIVILEYYVAKYRQRITRRFEIFKHNNFILCNNAHCDFTYDLNKNKWIDGKGYNVKIKSIVTHEQFESIEYKI